MAVAYRTVQENMSFNTESKCAYTATNCGYAIPYEVILICLQK